MPTSRFDGRWKLLVRSLLLGGSGASGARRALSVFRRQQRANTDISLRDFVQTLCRGEVTCTRPEEQRLTVKPLVCLFPATFKQNLLSFIHLVHSALPQATLLHLLECFKQEPHPNPWVTALVRQLERDVGAPRDEPLYTTQCSQRLKELSQRLVGSGETSGWAKYCSGQKPASASPSTLGLSDVGTQRKRKSNVVSPDSDNENTGQHNKRIKMDFGVGEDPAPVEKTLEKTSRGLEGEIQSGTSAEELQPPLESPPDVLPEHIKASITQIKELLESQAEWDESSTDVFKVLNDCDPTQVEVLCGVLGLPDVQEQTLPKLCSGVLALSPDLGYSTAATLIKSLLLGKVLSLSEPASRCLVTAVASLCSRYPRPVCHALIRPLLEEQNIGNPQSELLNRLVESCLDHHYRLLVLQMTFNIAWSEAVLSIIHSLLDSKPELNEELFTQFTEQLVSQAPRFTKSVKFAKMMLTVLTKFTSHVTDAHKHSLSGCLMLNETFLKKSLQAALKRITHT